MNCAYNVYFDVINKASFYEKNCYPLCPIECVSTNYNAFITYNYFSKEIYVDEVRKRKNFKSKYDNKTLYRSNILNKLTRVNIFYDSLSYTLITESVSMNGVSLLAAIGGFMGMFLGMSLMTQIEFLEIILRLFLAYVCKIKI